MVGLRRLNPELLVPGLASNIDNLLNARSIILNLDLGFIHLEKREVNKLGRSMRILLVGGCVSSHLTNRILQALLAFVVTVEPEL